MRALLMFLWLGTSALAQDLVDLITTEDLKELQEIIVSVATSCPDKIFTNQSDLAFAAKELQELVAGIAKVTSEAALTLEFKKDYPNACHVLSSNILSEIEQSKNSRKPCLKKWKGKCLYRQKQEFPVFAYYWPKYFIEASEKGNDPHPMFASRNKLYTKSREIARSLSNWLDISGPFKLVAKVVSASSAIKSATGMFMGHGFNFDVSASEMQLATRTAALTPFEKLRIRSNQDPEMTSFDVNIWPVGLSESIAKHLTICGEGGFQWPVPGVPMTCPVAMSRDAWSFWDSGMLDYLNPLAIRGVVSASSPAKCVADNIASIALDSYDSKGFTSPSDVGGGKGQKESATSNVPNNMRGVGFCSLPILGDAEAIAAQTLGLANAFSGPWCTMWGPTVPRASTSMGASDFAFPNAALKFKLLAHDLFGIPRGKKERWALAYPWETSGMESIVELMEPLLKSLKIEKVASEYLRVSGSGHSTNLLPPGSPLMLESFNLAGTAQSAKKLGAEVAYVAAVAATAEKAAQQTLKRTGSVEAAAAARTSAWVTAETVRARKEEMSGKSFIPGKKRIYTIFEEVRCEPKTPDGRPVFRKQIPGGWVWKSCRDAIKIEVRKYFQRKLLRRVCDNIFKHKLGEPFRKGE